MAEKILVPLDGSAYSDEVIKYAVGLAEKIDAEIIIMHAVEPFTKKSTALAQLKDDMVEQTNDLLKLAGEETITHAKSVVSDFRGSCKYVIKIGNPTDEIIRTAKGEGCTLIVIGSRGMNPVEKFLLGSVSSKVSMYAHIPVLIVKK